MQTIRTIPLLLALAIGAPVLALPSTAPAHGTTSDRRPQDAWMPDGYPQDTWMPDVAERVAALRERAARADAEARLRHRAETARGGQWWRAVAAVPARDREQ